MFEGCLMPLAICRGPMADAAVKVAFLLASRGHFLRTFRLQRLADGAVRSFLWRSGKRRMVEGGDSRTPDRLAQELGGGGAVDAAGDSHSGRPVRRHGRGVSRSSRLSGDAFLRAKKVAPGQPRHPAGDQRVVGLAVDPTREGRQAGITGTEGRPVGRGAKRHVPAFLAVRCRSSWPIIGIARALQDKRRRPAMFGGPTSSVQVVLQMGDTGRKIGRIGIRTQRGRGLGAPVDRRALIRRRVLAGSRVRIGRRHLPRFRPAAMFGGGNSGVLQRIISDMPRGWAAWSMARCCRAPTSAGRAIGGN